MQRIPGAVSASSIRSSTAILQAFQDCIHCSTGFLLLPFVWQKQTFYCIKQFDGVTLAAGCELGYIGINHC